MAVLVASLLYFIISIDNIVTKCVLYDASSFKCVETCVITLYGQFLQIL